MKYTQKTQHIFIVTMYQHTHPFNGPLSGTTQVSRYQKKVKPIWILLKQETVSGSGISWAICKSATRSRQITMPAPHHLVFYRLDALPAAQPTASKHWRHLQCTSSITKTTERWLLCTRRQDRVRKKENYINWMNIYIDRRLITTVTNRPTWQKLSCRQSLMITVIN